MDLVQASLFLDHYDVGFVILAHVSPGEIPVLFSIDCNIILAFAGQSTKSLRYATTYITFIRFHIDFMETAKHMVTPN